MNIALLTCKKFPTLIADDQLLIPGLAKHGITASPAIWNDENINWNVFDYLLFRSTWDYFEIEPQFNHWLDHIEKSGIKTLNPINIIQQNKHKFYLRELQQKGITIIPTIFIEKTNDLNLTRIIPQNWKKAVIKPAVSGGAFQTEAFNIEDIDIINEKYKTIAAQKDLLLQEFMPQIQTLGETSFIFFDKKFSHCVIKKPTEGDFRVQSQFGGNYSALDTSTALVKKAEKIIDTFPDNLLYARVDGIVIDGELLLMEVECIEPDLYFYLSDGANERFISAIAQQVTGSTPEA